MPRATKVFFGVTFALALTIGALSMASARLGPTVDSMTTLSSLDGTSVNSSIALTFTDPMNVASVERNFSIRPKIKGAFNWTGNEMIFEPSRPLRYSTAYTVSVRAASVSRAGKRLYRAFRQTFTTQSEHLLFLGQQGNEKGRLVQASVNGDRRIVGSDDGLIADYSVSFDRTLAVYTKRGGAAERRDEIWIVSLVDGSTQMVYRRPDWDMAQPHFSPDGRTVVFLATNVLLCQKYYGCYRDRTGPIIYLLDLHSRRVRPFQATSDVPITDFIDYSPEGQLAYTDLGSALTLADPGGRRVVHIPNRGNSLEYAGFDQIGDKAAFVGQTPESSGGDILVYARGKYIDVSRGIYDSASPSFSNSGNQIAYVAYRGEKGIEPIYGVNVYDFRTRRTVHVTSERLWSDWDPQWSPDDRYIAFVRSAPQEAMYMGSGVVWVVDSNGRNARPLGDVGKDIHWIT